MSWTADTCLYIILSDWKQCTSALKFSSRFIEERRSWSLLLSNEKQPWRQFSVLKFIWGKMRQNYHIEISQVTDYGPKDSNFPQNAWGLLDGTVHDHIFGVIPGNSDAIRTWNVKKHPRLSPWNNNLNYSQSQLHWNPVVLLSCQQFGLANIFCGKTNLYF